MIFVQNDKFLAYSSHKPPKAYFNKKSLSKTSSYILFLRGRKVKVIKIWMTKNALKLNLVRARLRIDPEIDETQKLVIEKTCPRRVITSS